MLRFIVTTQVPTTLALRSGLMAPSGPMVKKTFGPLALWSPTRLPLALWLSGLQHPRSVLALWPPLVLWSKNTWDVYTQQAAALADRGLRMSSRLA